MDQTIPYLRNQRHPRLCDFGSNWGLAELGGLYLSPFSGVAGISSADFATAFAGHTSPVLSSSVVALPKKDLREGLKRIVDLRVRKSVFLLQRHCFPVDGDCI